jgi:hypothetical protein
MSRLAALVLLALPLFAQLPPGTSRVTFREMTDATLFAATPDGTLWAASLFDRALERIGADASVEADLPPNWRGTHSMAAGPDGALWLGGSGWIARIDPATNAIQRWPQGTGVVTERILSGPDGNLWLIQGQSVGRIRLDGRFLSKYLFVSSTGSAFGTDGALYLAAPGKLVRVTAAGQLTTFAASLHYTLYSGPGFLWSGKPASTDPQSEPAGEILKLSYSGETLATYRVAMTPLASDALGNLWLRAVTDEGEIVGQLTPQGVLTRFGPLPALPSNDCFKRWYGGVAFLADGRVAMSDYYPAFPRTMVGPCVNVSKPEEFENTVTIIDPRIAPVISVQSLNPTRRRIIRR